MPPSLAVDAVLLLNALWFGAGFWFFSLRPATAAKLLAPKPARDTPLFETLSTAVRFLGGLNLALAVLAVLVLANRGLFPEPRQMALIAAVFFLAHGSQFAFNVPVALGAGRRREPAWPVLSGPMLRIFLIDAALTLSNGVLAASLVTG